MHAHLTARVAGCMLGTLGRDHRHATTAESLGAVAGHLLLRMLLLRVLLHHGLRLHLLLLLLLVRVLLLHLHHLVGHTSLLLLHGSSHLVDG